MNGVVSQFHKAYPGYAKTKVKVVWVPWTKRCAVVRRRPRHLVPHR